MARTSHIVVGIGAAVALAAGTAYLTMQYLQQAEVLGKGQTRLRSDHPTVRLNVKNPDSLEQLVVTVDGLDVTQAAAIDKRGVVVKGLAMGDGWHRVHVKAGHKGFFGPEVDQRFGVLVDTRKPRLALEPTPGGGFRSSVQIVGRTEKNTAVEVAWKGGRIDTTTATGAFLLRPELPDGPVALRVTAIDPVGNRSVKWRKVVVDSSAPTLTAKRFGVVSTLKQPLSGRVEDESPVKLWATLDGGPVKLTSGPDGTGPWKLPLQGTIEGEHELAVRVTDAAGNTTTLNRRFTVDTVEKLKDGVSLGPGARGKDVMQLQRRLRAEHLWKGPYSRFYNARTIAAVKAYQRLHAMPTDGIASPAIVLATSGKILVDLSKFRLWLIKDGKRIFTAPIATGAPGYDTPVGLFSISNMAKNPTWIPPNSPWAAGLEPIPPGPGNPLGSRWIGTSAPAVGFHATPSRFSIGHAASHGCMRMYQEDVEKLYDLVAVGMPIEIKP